MKQSIQGIQNRGGSIERIESSSRPGFFHHVDVERGFCSCEATVEVCRHRRQALVRAYKAKKLAARKTKTCKACGGYGRFVWGKQALGECESCNGSGRVVA